MVLLSWEHCHSPISIHIQICMVIHIHIIIQISIQTIYIYRPATFHKHVKDQNPACISVYLQPGQSCAGTARSETQTRPEIQVYWSLARQANATNWLNSVFFPLPTGHCNTCMAADIRHSEGQKRGNTFLKILKIYNIIFKNVPSPKCKMALTQPWTRYFVRIRQVRCVLALFTISVPRCVRKKLATALTIRRLRGAAQIANVVYQTSKFSAHIRMLKVPLRPSKLSTLSASQSVFHFHSELLLWHIKGGCYLLTAPSLSVYWSCSY